MKSLHIFLFILCGFTAFAQTDSIRGKVVDQQGNTIEAVYIEVLKDSTQVVGYALSDAFGCFQISLPEKQEYQIYATHVAFQPLSKRIKPSGNEIVFAMEERLGNLDEVVVTGYNKAMKMNNEGDIIFTPRTLGNTVTYNLPRLLQTLPGIQVSSGGISQNGRPTALLINGHKRSLNGKSIEAFLQVIPPDKIKEIIITPSSSAGDQASENGSINIILKKEENMLASQIGSQLNMRKGGIFGNGSGFLMYNKNNFYLDLSLSYYNVFERKDRREESSYVNSLETSLFDYQTKVREDDYFGSLNTEWKTKQGHKLFGAATGFYDNGTEYAENTMTFHSNEKQQRITRGNAHKDFEDDLYTVEVEFVTNDTLRHQHEIGYGIIWGKAHNNGYNNEVTTTGEENKELQHNTFNRHYGYQHQMKYNYKYLVNARSTWKVGTLITLSNINPKSQFIEKEQDTEDFLYDDKYKIPENTYAGFAEYVFKHKKTSISAGLRLEYTDYSALSLVDNKEHVYKRMDYFPFLSLYQKISPSANISFRLASGIDRPHFLDYVPNYQYTSKYAYTIGNPDLKPSKYYSATLGSMLLDFLYLEFTYLYTKDIISKIHKIDGDSFQEVTTHLNSSDENRIFFKMNCPYVFLNNRLSGYLGYWMGYAKYTNLKVDLGEFHKTEYKGLYVMNQMQYEVIDNLNIGYEIFYQPKLSLQQSITDHYFKLGFDASYRVKNLDLGLTIANVLNTNMSGIEFIDQVHRIYSTNRHQPIYSITLKYNFGNSDKRKYHKGIDSSRFQ